MITFCGMKVKFQTFFRAVMGLMLVVLLWSAWAGSPPRTNLAPPVAESKEEGQAGSPSPKETAASRQIKEAHYLTFGLDRVPLLQEREILGEPLWKYTASLIYILLAFYVAKIIDRLACVWFKKLAERTETRLDDLLLQLLHGPIKVLVFVLFLHAGLNIFRWPETARLYLSKGMVLIVAASLTYLALKIIDLLLDFWRRRAAHEVDRKFSDQLLSLIRKSLNVFVIVVAILVTAQNIGINITAAITSLSIGGLAVGLAAQDTLANLFGAVAVFADKPFRVGDQVRLADTEGRVESVGMRSTRVRNQDGYLVAIPNKTVGNATIINITQRPNIKTVMNLALPRNLPGDKVKQALKLLGDIYRAHPMTQDVWISFNQFAGGNINILVVHWWKGTDYQKYLAGIQEMNLAVKERFDAEGIGMV